MPRVLVNVHEMSRAVTAEGGDVLLLDYRSAADVLGVSVSTLRRLVAAGDVSPVRIGRRSLFLRSDLEELVRRAVRAGHGDSAGSQGQ